VEDAAAPQCKLDARCHRSIAELFVFVGTRVKPNPWLACQQMLAAPQG